MNELQLCVERMPVAADQQSILDWIETSLQDLSGDVEYLAGMRRTVPGSARLYGVRVPQLRALAKAILRDYRKDSELLQSLADACWQKASREHRLIGLFLLAPLKLNPQERWQIGLRYLPDVADWETCDQLCMNLLGLALARDAALMDELEGWISSENFWVRRAALVSTVYLRRAKFDSLLARALDQRALDMCLALLDDDEGYIRKAVDWTVRAVLARHYELGRDWMMQRLDGQLSRVARSTLRKAAAKLEDPDRDLFLSGLN